MGDVLKFQKRKKAVAKKTTKPTATSDVIKMVQLADKIDALIVDHLSKGDLDPKDLAGILAHRLGTLMRNIDDKSKLWDICQQVVERQAALDAS